MRISSWTREEYLRFLFAMVLGVAVGMVGAENLGASIVRMLP